jgi:hypothetical protein
VTTPWDLGNGPSLINNPIAINAANESALRAFRSPDLSSVWRDSGADRNAEAVPRNAGGPSPQFYVPNVIRTVLYS